MTDSPVRTEMYYAPFSAHSCRRLVRLKPVVVLPRAMPWVQSGLGVAVAWAQTSGGGDRCWVVVGGIRLVPQASETADLLCSRAADNSRFESG